MMMTLVNALLQPNYSSVNVNLYLNVNKTISYPQFDIEDDNLRTKIVSIDNISLKDACEVNLSTQNNLDVPTIQRSNMKSLKNSMKIVNHKKRPINKHIKKNANCRRRPRNLNSYTTGSLYKRKAKNIDKQINAYGESIGSEFKESLISIIKIRLVHNVDSNYGIVLGHKNYRTINNRNINCINNMNIKHLKLFKSTNNSNIYHLHVYLYKLSTIIYNLDINIHIIDIYSKDKIFEYNLHNMPNIKEMTEIYIKLPIDLYNVLVLKTVDMSFNDNSWQRLEQLLNILCNTKNGNLSNFDIVWWNMQTCWTSFRKNPNEKWIKEFTVNCEVIPEDEKIMAIYTTVDGNNVPINIEIKTKQVLLDLIANI